MEIQDLLDSVGLEDVRCVESVAQLRLDPDTGLRDWEGPEFAGEATLDVNPVSWDERIETWFRLTMENPEARLTAAFAVVYARESDEEIPDSVRREFLEKVAAMACFPYLREAIQRLASELRLGNVLLPIMRQGEVQIALNSDTLTPA